jgi:hypothetical protein
MEERKKLALYEMRSLWLYLSVMWFGWFTQKATLDGQFIYPRFIRHHLTDLGNVPALAALGGLWLMSAYGKQRPLLLAAAGTTAGFLIEAAQARSSGQMDWVDMGCYFAGAAFYVCRHRRYRIRLLKEHRFFCVLGGIFAAAAMMMKRVVLPA